MNRLRVWAGDTRDNLPLCMQVTSADLADCEYALAVQCPSRKLRRHRGYVTDESIQDQEACPQLRTPVGQDCVFMLPLPHFNAHCPLL